MMMNLVSQMNGEWSSAYDIALLPDGMYYGAKLDCERECRYLGYLEDGLWQCVRHCLNA